MEYSLVVALQNGGINESDKDIRTFIAPLCNCAYTICTTIDDS